LGQSFHYFFPYLQGQEGFTPQRHRKNWASEALTTDNPKIVELGTPVTDIVHLYYASLGPMVDLRGWEEKGLTREFIVTHLGNDAVFQFRPFRRAIPASKKLLKSGSARFVTRKSGVAIS
jgi:hypothetical protein